MSQLYFVCSLIIFKLISYFKLVSQCDYRWRAYDLKVFRKIVAIHDTLQLPYLIPAAHEQLQPAKHPSLRIVLEINCSSCTVTNAQRHLSIPSICITIHLSGRSSDIYALQNVTWRIFPNSEQDQLSTV